jgi:fatty acid desaturase
MAHVRKERDRGTIKPVELLKAWIRLGRLQDLAAYVAVSTLILSAVFGLLALGMSWNVFVKWIGLAIMTSIVFWPFTTELRIHPQNRALWVARGISLTAHYGLWILFLRHVAIGSSSGSSP